MLLGDDDLFLGGDDVAQVLGFKIRIATARRLRLVAIHYALKLFMGHAHDDLAKQRGKAAIGVERETQVARLRGQALHSLFIRDRG